MRVWQKNERLKAALGIRSIEFTHYRAGRAHWTVTMEDGEQFTLSRRAGRKIFVHAPNEASSP